MYISTVVLLDLEITLQKENKERNYIASDHLVEDFLNF